MNRNYDYVLQQNTTDCGIASIMTVLMYYGIKPSREKIVSKLNKKYDGYTAYDLVKVSKSYGIDSYGIKTDLLSIKKLPVIAHTIRDKNMFHFIVIFEVNKKNKTLKVMDPSEGIKIITFEEFEKMTTNIFLVFKGDKKKKIKDKRFKKEIIKIFRSNKRIILKTLFLSLLYVLFSLIFNYYLKMVLAYNKHLTFLHLILVVFLNIVILKNGINYIKNKLILNLSVKLDKEITNKVTNHILNLPYEYFISKQAGELVTIIEDIENFKEIVTKIFILSVVDLILSIVVIIYTSILNIYIGLALFVMILGVFLLTKKFQYIFNDLFVKYKVNRINYTSSLINYFTSFETVKNLNVSKNVSSILSKKYYKSLENDKNYNKQNYKYNFFLNLFIDLFYCIFIFLASFISYSNDIGFLDIVLFSSIFYLVIGLISNITESLSLYKVYSTSVDIVLDCLEVKQEEITKSKFEKINKIVFKNVRYEKDYKQILNNVNLTINKNDKVFITGESGLGKSTLMKLLLQYYNLTDGKILIDGININDLDLSFIRENITYIGQNEELFPGSIISNMNLVSCDEEKIKEMADITLLNKFLKENNMDLNYVIEEGGFNLSGGEKKKVILTRGLLHFKNVLILDEVFNEISPFEEKTILNNLFLKYPDKIIIMISHRNNNKNMFNKKYQLKGDGSLYEIK